MRLQAAIALLMNLQNYGCSNCDVVSYIHIQEKLQGLVLLIPPPSSLMLGLADYYIIFICLKNLCERGMRIASGIDFLPSKNKFAYV
jgi:hypothetical protein